MCESTAVTTTTVYTCINRCPVSSALKKIEVHVLLYYNRVRQSSTILQLFTVPFSTYTLRTYCGKLYKRTGVLAVVKDIRSTLLDLARILLQFGSLLVE